MLASAFWVLLLKPSEDNLPIKNDANNQNDNDHSADNNTNHNPRPVLIIVWWLCRLSHLGVHQTLTERNYAYNPICHISSCVK